MKNKNRGLWFEICVFCECVQLAFFGEKEDTGEMSKIFNEDGTYRIVTKQNMLDNSLSGIR